MIKVFLKGITTGFILQLAVGPVFFFLMNTVLQKTLLDGFFAVIAVTIVDYIYISFAIVGVGRLLEKEKIKYTLGLVSSIVLLLFGIQMVMSVINAGSANISVIDPSQSIYTSFISAFALTISSPLTIVFWTGVFAARSIEYSFTKKELLVFGLAAGSATFLFLGSSILVLTILKSSIPLLVVQVANLLIGFLLIVYGIVRGIKISRTNKGDT